MVRSPDAQITAKVYCLLLPQLHPLALHVGAWPCLPDTLTHQSWLSGTLSPPIPGGAGRGPA